MMATPLVIAVIASLSIGTPASARAAPVTDLEGTWIGATWDEVDLFQSGVLRMQLAAVGGAGTATVYAPHCGLFGQVLSLAVSGDTVTIGDPDDLGFTGLLAGDAISGDFYQSAYLTSTWRVVNAAAGAYAPGSPPGPPCDELPPMYCTGSAAYCGELIAFEPADGPGYADIPNNGETVEDQIYSYLRRDFVQLIKYATARVACVTAGWGAGSPAPLALGLMSEANGDIPGTSIGYPFYADGVHEGGRDIDTAYYQLYTPDNLVRPVGVHHAGTTDVYHLLGEPFALDRWRTALFVAYLSQHPGLTVIGVDGQVGLVLESALDELVALGWIDPQLRASIPLDYEVTNEYRGWFFFHHHRMFIRISLEVSAAPDEFAPEPPGPWLECYPNPFNPRTTLRYHLPESRAVRLAVFDLSGRLVRVLSDGPEAAGRHAVAWDGRDAAGREVGSGVYLARLDCGGEVQTVRMGLIR